jgi:phosphatidylglycerol lysyltransferase
VSPDAREKTRRLVLQHGWNAASYQLVNDSIAKWFTSGAVVGYVSAGKWKVVAGPPVCDPAQWRNVLDQWESFAGRDVCYFGAGDRFTQFLESRGAVAQVSLGAQPSWNPQNWEETTRSVASLRMQFSRAKNKGVTVSEWGAERAHELTDVLSAWLRRRGLPPLHFLVEPETLGYLRDRRLFVAEQQGRPVAFLVLCPVPSRNGWLTEEFPRLPDAPNGTVELMMDRAALSIAGEGSNYLTMGLAPLARLENDAHNPVWLRIATRWARAHGRRFYNFRGLESFKTKFRPDHWEPIRAVVVGREFTPSALYAVATAFSQQPAWRALAVGVGRAVAKELRSLVSVDR